MDEKMTGKLMPPQKHSRITPGRGTKKAQRKSTNEEAEGGRNTLGTLARMQYKWPKAICHLPSQASSAVKEAARNWNHMKRNMVAQRRQRQVEQMHQVWWEAMAHTMTRSMSPMASDIPHQSRVESVDLLGQLKGERYLGGAVGCQLRVPGALACKAKKPEQWTSFPQTDRLLTLRLNKKDQEHKTPRWMLNLISGYIDVECLPDSVCRQARCRLPLGQKTLHTSKKLVGIYLMQRDVIHCII